MANTNDDKALKMGLQYAQPNVDGEIAPFNIVTTAGDTLTDKSYVEEARDNVDNSNALDGRLQDSGEMDEALFDEEQIHIMSTSDYGHDINKPGQGKGVTIVDIDDSAQDEIPGKVI
ncbi:MAG: hypothetical protein M3Q44_08080 [bacterium]|nr:hypothetical protein [bacterium]